MPKVFVLGSERTVAYN